MCCEITCLLGGYGEITAVLGAKGCCVANGSHHNVVVGIRILKEDLIDLPYSYDVVIGRYLFSYLV